MTSLSREVRLFNAKKGYFYFHLMVCEIFLKGQHHRSEKEKLRATINLSLFNSLKPDLVLSAARYLGQLESVYIMEEKGLALSLVRSLKQLWNVLEPHKPPLAPEVTMEERYISLNSCCYCKHKQVTSFGQLKEGRACDRSCYPQSMTMRIRSQEIKRMGRVQSTKHNHSKLRQRESGKNYTLIL